jgi:hypothetical protein
VLFIGLHKMGGWSGLCQAVQQTPVPDAMHIHKPWADPAYPFWGVILGAVYGGTFYWGMDQVNVQRMLGARDLKRARWGAMLGALLKLTQVVSDAPLEDRRELHFPGVLRNTGDHADPVPGLALYTEDRPHQARRHHHGLER